jgi:hypothetical protein
MAEQQNKKKDIAVDLECDDEFEEFGNEGEYFSSTYVNAQTAQQLENPSLKQKLIIFLPLPLLFYFVYFN